MAKHKGNMPKRKCKMRPKRVLETPLRSETCSMTPEVVSGVVLDMLDSILISLDLTNHQKHPKQRKNHTQ